jgi:hypothetical protein
MIGLFIAACVFVFLFFSFTVVRWIVFLCYVAGLFLYPSIVLPITVLLTGAFFLFTRFL